MKKNLRSLILLFLIFASCESWLDFEQEPNYVEELPLDMAFFQSTIDVFWEVGSFYNLVGGFWSQHYAQSNASVSYSALEKFDKTSLDELMLMSNTESWKGMFCALRMLQQYGEKARQLKEWNYYAAFLLIQSYTVQLMVDFYGEIPNPFPREIKDDNDFEQPLTDGYSIYIELLRNIDLALEKLNQETYSHPIADDPIFNGQMDKWKEFAYTLKLKIYLRLAYYDPELAENEISELFTEKQEFLNQDATMSFTNIPIISSNGIKDGMNPLFYYNAYIVSINTNIRVSMALFEYLKSNNDKRINWIMREPVTGNSNSSDTLYKDFGMPQGGYQISYHILDPAKIAVFRQDKLDPVWLFSEVESYFLQAEACARGWGTNNAKELYNKAISADFTRKEISFDPDSLLGDNGIYKYPENGSPEEQLEAIIMAKWVALAGTQSIETFFDLNRTGYPGISNIPAWENNTFNIDYEGGKLTYSLEGATNGMFPKRIPIPDLEVQLNKNITNSEEITKKVFWDKK